MQRANYADYTERKLFNALKTTKTTLKKLQSEQARISKKIDATLEKQWLIRSALAQKLDEPNEATISDIQNAQSLGIYKSSKAIFDDIEREIEQRAY